MPEGENYIGHCVHCKGKKKLMDPMPHTMTNTKTKNHGVQMIKGRCPDCNKPVYVVIGHS